MNLKNKIVVVTGASRGFGAALSWNFAKAGATVVVTARRLEDAENTCQKIVEILPDASVVPFVCDIEKLEDIHSLFSFLKATYNTVDILVNNGAVWLATGGFLEASDEQIISTLNSGCTGPIILTKALIPLLQKSSFGNIVNVISKCGEVGYLGSEAHEAFYAMKHGHSAFASVLGHRLRDSGIRTISLYPPNFQNVKSFEELEVHDENDSSGELHARDILAAINFAVTQPRSSFINKIMFEENRTKKDFIERGKI